MKEIGGNVYKEWMTTDYTNKTNYKPEGKRYRKTTNEMGR